MMLFREQYPLFIYKSFSLEKSESKIHATFNFTIEGLCDFSPEIYIDTGVIPQTSPFDGDCAKRIIFCLGLVEAVSYFKAVCPKKIRIECGALEPQDAALFKKLWYNGLGEFFYINGIKLGYDEFIELEFTGEKLPAGDEFVSAGLNLIPVGGGKDSCVTAQLLKESKEKNVFLTVNDQQARTDCVTAAGYSKDRIIRITRTIDSRLLELNAKGFYNGHTPFSAIVAFLSEYCAYLTGCEFIALSNESSANEGNTGTETGEVNHQYSKSFEFEHDFSGLASRLFTDKIKYFSILRPFNELQIAKYFADNKQYLSVFRSCNRGSKKNIWCCDCAKCLFVYGILSPFLTDEESVGAFGKNMFENESLLECFRGLTGMLPVKPFECVGTASEFNYAISVKIGQLKSAGKSLPFLLEYFEKNSDVKGLVAEDSLLREFNTENLVPPVFSAAVEEMYRYVRGNSTDS